MANLTITTTEVRPGSEAVKESGAALEAITAGQAVYKNPTTNKFGLADDNSATAFIRTPYGIALNGAGIDQSVTVQRSGHINIGAAVVQGKQYFLSDTPGAICPEADVGAGEYPAAIGFAVSTTQIDIDIREAGVVV